MVQTEKHIDSAQAVIGHISLEFLILS